MRLPLWHLVVPEPGTGVCIGPLCLIFLTLAFLQNLLISLEGLKPLLGILLFIVGLFVVFFPYWGFLVLSILNIATRYLKDFMLSVELMVVGVIPHTGITHVVF